MTEPQEPLDAEVVELHGGKERLQGQAARDYRAVVNAALDAARDALEPDEVVDAEVVDVAEDLWQPGETECTTDAALTGATPSVELDRAGPHAEVRMVPTGRECWWRLYSTPTSFMREHQDHGVRAVYAHRVNPHLLVLDLDGYGRHELLMLAWRVNQTDPSRTGQKELGEGKAAPPAKPGPDSIDLLCDFPPTLPGKPRQWQQMTQPGQARHPGDDRGNWEFYDWWQGGEAVQFEPGYTWPPGDKGSTLQKFDRHQKRRGITDADLAGEGFHDLGYTKGIEKQEDS